VRPEVTRYQGTAYRPGGRDGSAQRTGTAWGRAARTDRARLNGAQHAQRAGDSAVAGSGRPSSSTVNRLALDEAATEREAAAAWIRLRQGSWTTVRGTGRGGRGRGFGFLQPRSDLEPWGGRIEVRQVVSAGGERVGGAGWVTAPTRIIGGGVARGAPATGLSGAVEGRGELRWTGLATCGAQPRVCTSERSWQLDERASLGTRRRCPAGVARRRALPCSEWSALRPCEPDGGGGQAAR
jgi:hypothetical protein